MERVQYRGEGCPICDGAAHDPTCPVVDRASDIVLPVSRRADDLAKHLYETIDDWTMTVPKTAEQKAAHEALNALRTQITIWLKRHDD